MWSRCTVWYCGGTPKAGELLSVAGGDVATRSVTVGDRLAQKSDRLRPLSLRPVSLRRTIYMQFLLIVLLCCGGGDPAAAATTTVPPSSPTPL